MRLSRLPVLMVLFALPAMADCREATDRYNAALDEIDLALRRYTRCITNSRGEDECSSEFRLVQYAQSSFEAAVSEVQAECRR